MKYIIALLATASLLIAAPAQADFDDPVHTFKNGSLKIEKADREVSKRKITYVEDIDLGNRLYVELNNGATFELVPCPAEDSRNCHWDAHSVGNKVGHSFIDIRGKVIYLPKN